ncbi:hypothetical protein HPP92_017922 [Vanilla planifolia]|uniref:Ureidoglycolate hydrolase n=1 Tax=Vanilla planifolia TaxID=51239 RepID=A0A835UMD6_VANPL|nr:hypothetical protein HPP92_017922 [Vanilla planifolia]
MASGFSRAEQLSLLLFSNLLLASCLDASHEEEARKTMEDFSGYPTHSHPSYSCLSPSSLLVDIQGLQTQIEELSAFSDAPAPAVTRILYTHKDVLARRYIKQRMNEAGLSLREDAVGNIFGRWDGAEPDLPAVATGSHIDAIPYSGRYDGVVGVLGAIEAINVLKRSLLGMMYKVGYWQGSLELAHALHEVVDEQNISFVEAARTAGYASQEDLSSVFLKKQNYFSFIELHIEQGPILEQEGIPIGVVTAIAAPASIQVEFEGNGGHAGAVLMPARNDAGLAAAELSLAVEKHVLDSGSIDTVGTVGVMNLHPAAINSIPSKAHIEIDARDIDEERRNVVVNKIYQSAVQIAEKRGVRLSKFKIVNQDPPALSSSMIIKTMEDAAKQLNFDSMRMISRAYHDSLFMARISPMGMIFIPCYRGYSHKPEEFASPENIAKGVKVLALTLAKLSS